jgi:hypothetical protein
MKNYTIDGARVPACDHVGNSTSKNNTSTQDFALQEQGKLQTFQYLQVQVTLR